MSENLPPPPPNKSEEDVPVVEAEVVPVEAEGVTVVDDNTTPLNNLIITIKNKKIDKVYNNPQSSSVSELQGVKKIDKSIVDVALQRIDSSKKSTTALPFGGSKNKTAKRKYKNKRKSNKKRKSRRTRK